MVNVSTGQPYCNPFIPPGFPQNLSPSAVTFNGVNNGCITGLREEMKTAIAYPNPTRDFFNISIAEGQSVGVKIMDMNGRTVWQADQVYNTDKIDVATFANGIFFVRIKTRDAVYVEKLVVSK